MPYITYTPNSTYLSRFAYTSHCIHEDTADQQRTGQWLHDFFEVYRLYPIVPKIIDIFKVDVLFNVVTSTFEAWDLTNK